MKLNEKMVDRILKTVNDKYPFFDKIYYKYYKDYMTYTGDRYDDHTFMFIINMGKIKREFPNGMIDYDYIKKNPYFTKVTELFVEYNDDQGMVDYGDDIYNFTSMLMTIFLQHKDKYSILYDLPI
jgi:hypothetical protein